MKTFWILRGEGIECEKESFRFFSTPNLKLKCEYVLIPEILANPEKALSNLKAGDWMVFPGGFSFADHLGSGRLLSFKFGQKKVFEQLIQKKVHMIGICNGFQILSAGKLFGDNVFLERNQPGGFVNKNVKLKGWREQDFYFTCRHGEGRLVIEGDFKAGVQTLMTYNDEHFNNGSQDKIAGLVARHQDSYVVGLMPHPEIALRAMDQADFVGPEHPGEFAARMEEADGDGVRFFNDLLKDVEEKRFL